MLRNDPGYGMRFFLIIGVILLILCLHETFPYILQDEHARMRALYLFMLLAAIAAGRRRGPNARPYSKLVRDAAIWMAIVVTLVFAYSFHDELGHSRLMAELMPSHVQSNGDGTLSLKASEGGHFYVEGEVNGVPARFLIDTGATGIVLTPDDAKRMGMDMDKLDYSQYFSTANGIGKGATIVLNSLKVGNITMDHLPASVNKSWMQESLLGMSFLRRLRGFKVEGDRLVLMP